MAGVRKGRIKKEGRETAPRGKEEENLSFLPGLNSPFPFPFERLPRRLAKEGSN